MKVKCLRCGNEITGQYGKFKNKLKVCSCSNRKNEIHITDSRWHRIMHLYQGMKHRCYQKTSKSYPRYGGKGIKICDEWLEDFKIFYEWSINNDYKDDLTIDRIDSAQSYEPSNCRWIAAKEQSRNRLNTLKEAQVIDIKKMINEGAPCKGIAAIYNIPVKRVYYIKSGLTWSDVT